MTERRSKQNLADFSKDAQAARLLERLCLGPVDVFTARHELNILHPAARIRDLREKGYPIKTHLKTLEDPAGYTHPRCAVYYLSASQEAA